MNETWGPPIRMSDGKLVPRLMSTGHTSSLYVPVHRISDLKALTPQYSARKRRGTTPPPSPIQPSKKKPKKKHKKFLSPGGVGTVQDADMVEDTDEGNESKPDNAASTGKKKLALHAPRICAFCNGGPKVPGPLLPCLICSRKVYCSEGCQTLKAAAGNKYCGMLCEADANAGKKKVAFLPPSLPKSPNGSTCIVCSGVPKTLHFLLGCSICFRKAFCSHDCRKQQLMDGRGCSKLCEAEHTFGGTASPPDDDDDESADSQHDAADDANRRKERSYKTDAGDEPELD